MRITITEKDKTIRLVFPTFLILNRVGVYFLKKHIKIKGMDMTFLRDIRSSKIVKAIKEARQNFPDWYLVNIETSNGEKILIKL